MLLYNIYIYIYMNNSVYVENKCKLYDNYVYVRHVSSYI